MRARSDCFKMRVTQRRKSTCLSLTRNLCCPFLEFFLIHLLTLAPLLILSSLEGVCTHQVLPVARDASPQYDWSNALSLSPSLPEPNNMFLTQFFETKPVCQRFHVFHCEGLLIRVYPARNIGRLDHRKSLVSMSTQLLFSRAMRSFVFAHGLATHIYRAV